ncbi:MAG: YeeE/YedE thiosulfate transporter family protein [Bacteroidota bacterium]|nr:YeeE/YedE thiosulfate transporter family protein [Bacteroidota bacterium]
MFPLVPNLISDELNLIVALVIGIAFGFILEQAGFSSSKKLAGVFYGYDFTVLRVFFTAGVTAMSGVIILGYLGWLDIDFVYINPTFLQAAILGGVIMGFGFIIGGYCPGTSITGMAIGKIDAMFFVGGGLIGVFAYAEMYPWFEGITNASALGNIRIFNSIGISQGLFALILIAVAVGAFMMTTMIEKKVNPEGPAKSFNTTHHRLAGVGILLVGIALLFLPDYKERLFNKISNEEFLRAHSVKEMTTDELAFRIIDKDPKLTIIDVRSQNEFAAMALPGSINIEQKQIFQKEFSEVLGQRHKKKVFVGNNENEERIAALIARELGYENIHVLCNGLPSFMSAIIRLQPVTNQCSFANISSENLQQHIINVDAQQAIDTERFRTKASITLAAMIKVAKNSMAKPTKLVKKVAGGC